ncbi:MAG: hypothetical protein RRY54_07080 [Angelakisella sp.]
MMCCIIVTMSCNSHNGYYTIMILRGEAHYALFIYDHDDRA